MAGAARTITVTSASKTFNVAALHCAVAHVGHDGLWEKISSLPMSYLGGPSALSVAAHVTAWTACEDWRSALLTQLRDRRDLLTTWASDHGVRLRSHRATYLAWLDFADTRIAEDPAARILDHAQVRVAAGPDYTNPTDIDARTFVRLNFATSHAVLEDILDRITHVL